MLRVFDKFERGLSAGRCATPVNRSYAVTCDIYRDSGIKIKGPWTELKPLPVYVCTVECDTNEELKAYLNKTVKEQLEVLK